MVRLSSGKRLVLRGGNDVDCHVESPPKAAGALKGNGGNSDGTSGTYATLSVPEGSPHLVGNDYWHTDGMDKASPVRGEGNKPAVSSQDCSTSLGRSCLAAIEGDSYTGSLGGELNSIDYHAVNCDRSAAAPASDI